MSNKVVKFALTSASSEFVGRLDTDGRNNLTSCVQEAALFDSIPDLLERLAVAIRGRELSPFSLRNNGIARVTITSGVETRRVVTLGSGTKVTGGFAIRGTIDPCFYNGPKRWDNVRGVEYVRLFPNVDEAVLFVSEHLSGMTVTVVGVNVEKGEDTYEVEYL